MKVTGNELDRVILQAVSEDYECFDTVLSKLSRMQCQVCCENAVERSLLTSLARNLVRAFLLHADPPYTTAVNADLDTVQRYWYCITEEGREYLRRMS